MRVLLTIPPAVAHLFPVIPLAWALQGAGHQVCVASHPDTAESITAAGLTAVPVGADVDLASAAQACAADARMDRIADALPLDPTDANFRLAVRTFALNPFRLYYLADKATGGNPSVVDDLVRFALSWKPDLVLWDTYFFPAAIAARACGAAHARVLMALDHFGWIRTRFVQWLGRPGSAPHTDLMAELMEPTLRRFGQRFDEELLLGQWTIDLKPPGMRLPLGLRCMPVRRVPYTGAAIMPEWLWDRPERPRVCLSLGMSTRKFFAAKAGAFPMSELLDMAGSLDIELVATLNPAQLASVSRVPGNVRVVDYLPLNQLLPTCSVIIHHGGGGTFAAAVAEKVPQLITPGMGADRVETATYVADRGAGLLGPYLDGADFSVDLLRRQLGQLLDEPSFRDGVAELYDEMMATPSPNDAVPKLERLTARHRSRPAVLSGA